MRWGAHISQGDVQESLAFHTLDAGIILTRKNPDVSATISTCSFQWNQVSVIMSLARPGSFSNAVKSASRNYGHDEIGTRPPCK